MAVVSIVTPAYNCKSTFSETFRSVMNQTFSDWEWLIVEDNSTDGSYEFIRDLVKNDARIKLFQTPKNSGAAIARNISIEKASSKYIAFIDADDLWKQEKLEKQIQFMKSSNYVFTCTDYELLYKNGKKKKYASKRKDFNYKKLLATNAIGCLTVIYDAEQIGKVFMPIDCPKREDHGAWLDITKKGIVAHKLSECLSTYRVNDSSVSSNKQKMFKYQYKLYRKHERFGPIKSFWFTFVLSLNKLFKKY